jgi:carbonic anhydrase
VKSTAEKWGIRGVLDTVNAQVHAGRTQDPIDVRRAAVDVEPEPHQAFDDEAYAIHCIVSAVRPLDGEAQQRVLQYIGLRFPAHKFEG